MRESEQCYQCGNTRLEDSAFCGAKCKELYWGERGPPPKGVFENEHVKKAYEVFKGKRTPENMPVMFLR